MTIYLVIDYSLVLTFSRLNSEPGTVQVVLSTAHPAKFSEAVTRALQHSSKFNFERDILPVEFKGLLEKKRNVIDVEAPTVGLVKEVIERFAQAEAPTIEATSV